jgi:UDP-N-acetylmuramoylalanine--D-glutamate ligase
MNAVNDIHKALVVGLGYRTGLATSNFLAGRGSEVIVSDIKSREQLTDVIERLDRRVDVISGEQGPHLLDDTIDLVVLSPGVPKSIPLIHEAVRRGIPVISEIELAYRYCRGSIIAITGTDGKSTTTALTGHILRELGVDTFVGGNIGIPFISFAESTTDSSVSVLELSSFQLETINTFKPDVSAILNVSADHLDRYADIDDYFNTKLRIGSNQNEDDFFIYNRDDEYISRGLHAIQARKMCFSLSDQADAYYRDKIFIKKDRGARDLVDPARMGIIGLHNIQNTMAALLMVLSVLDRKGVQPDYEGIERACYSFEGLPHRMEIIGEFQGRSFINDSKATTVAAVEMALKSLDGKIALILGGRTKGDDYSRLMDSMGNVRSLILIGESSVEFSRIFEDFNRVTASSLEDALKKAMQLSGEGDTVLLSPACASFDMFGSYEERGEKFRECVNKLIRGEIAWT